jgi:dTDP-glucose pyrophosphorylase
MNIVIPIAGKGSRFLDEAHRNPEYGKPKPLINLRGQIMMKWALSSYPLNEDDKLIFIVRQDHIDEFHIDEELKKVFGESIKVLVQTTPLRGMADTVLITKEFIDNEEPLLITDADHYIEGESIFKEIEKSKDIDGVIPIFYANHPKWSYSKTDEEGRVIEVAEKMQISRNAHVGSYYFSKGRDYVWAAEEMIDEGDRTNGEFYVAPVYNYLVRRGKNIRLVRPKFMHGLGIPKDVERFLVFLNRGEVEHKFGEFPLQKNFEKIEEIHKP